MLCCWMNSVQAARSCPNAQLALNGQIRKEFEAAGVKFHNADVPAYRKATASFYTSFPQWPAGLFEQVRTAASGQ